MMNEIDEVASKKELAELRAKLGMGMLIPISKEEAEQYKTMKTLPKDVYKETDGFGMDTEKFFIYSTNIELSDEEKKELFLLRNCLNIRTIKRCAVALTTIICVSMALYILLFFGLFAR